MRKFCAFLAGILLFLLVLTGFKLNMDTQISKNKEAVRNNRSFSRFWSSETHKNIIDENTLPIFGSSELVSLGSYETAVGNFLNGDEMNVVTIGAGYFQSLYHTIALGSIAQDIPAKKVALFLSPQWFSKDGYEAAAYASKMSENELLDFLSNRNISKEHKMYVLERNEQLLQNSPTQLSRIKRYSNAVKNPISVDRIYMWIMNQYWDLRAEYEVYKALDTMDNNLPKYDLDTLDYDAILKLAEEQGKASCTNNDFGINDDYWDTYVAKTYAKGEVVDKKQCYTQSPEYKDLMCFLDVAKELDIEVILVSIPVNGKWYKYQGVLCDEYYQNIRDIAGKYSNVEFADMSIYEDELYFLRDIMHLGWKGWARINEILYNEFTEK